MILGRHAVARPHRLLEIDQRIDVVRHVSYSARMNAPSASGVPPTGTAPDLTILPRTSGSASATLTAALSFLISAGGVFAGASKAYQFDASVLG